MLDAIVVAENKCYDDLTEEQKAKCKFDLDKMSHQDFQSFAAALAAEVLAKMGRYPFKGEWAEWGYYNLSCHEDTLPRYEWEDEGYG